jgi:hypothetical protein
MNYRLAKESEWPQVIKMVAEQHYVPEPYSLGGHWMVAESDGKIHGAIWFFMEAPHMFIDYWTATNSKVATKLLGALIKNCPEIGARYLHATILEGSPGLRMATEGFGGMDDGPYRRVFKEIPHGV